MPIDKSENTSEKAIRKYIKKNKKKLRLEVIYDILKRNAKLYARKNNRKQFRTYVGK